MLQLLGYTSDTHQIYLKFMCSLSALPVYIEFHIQYASWTANLPLFSNHFH